MEDKVNYSLVGAFVLSLGAALTFAILWLATGLSGQKRYDPYQTVVVESVAGLSIDAPVKYLGVDVGKVIQIGIDPQNPTHVRLRFQIERGTPIKQDTEAVLKTQGLTGIGFIELSGGSADSPPLTPSIENAIPTIRSRFANTLVKTSSSRALSEGFDRIVGIALSIEGVNGGESTLPPLSSINPIPVSPWVFNTASVSCLIGVPRSI